MAGAIDMAQIELPLALSPWAPYLGLFPAPLNVSIGSLVQRLDRLLGPDRTTHFSDSEEPEGYDGIARRGSYERLLISEWLLAQEIPDEFLRRAANNEQAFLELARKSPVGQKSMLALFDCGPNQLGSPRLVHLAMLIILARRAEALGCTLKWGLLNLPAAKLEEGLTIDGTNILLRSRQTREVGPTDVELWQERLNSDWQNTWIVAGRRTQKLVKKQPRARLQIDDVLEPDRRAVYINFSQPGKRQLEFNLPLPEEEHCAQLLRNPFNVAFLTRGRKIDPSSSLSSEGRLVCNGSDNFLVPGETPDVLFAYRGPRHLNGGQIKQRQYRSRNHKPIIAAAIKVPQMPPVLITSTERNDALAMEIIGRKSSPSLIELGLPFELIKQEHHSVSACVASPLKVDELWVLLGQHLIAIRTWENNAQTCIEIDNEVIALKARGPQVTYAKQTADGTQVITKERGKAPTVMKLPQEVADIYLGDGGNRGLERLGLIAWQSEMDHSWWLTDRYGSVVIELEDGDTVLGVCGRFKTPPFSALLVRSANQEVLKLVGATERAVIQTNGSIITSACTGANSLVAYATAAGDVFIHELENGNWVEHSKNGRCTWGKSSVRPAE
jgi:hypothetical protein